MVSIITSCFQSYAAANKDMDGTLLNTEDLYTETASEILAEYGKGPLTWDVKIKLQGRPGPEANKMVIAHYDLPISFEDYFQKALEIQATKWPRTKFLPGAWELLLYLKENNIPIALGTSSNKISYERKVSHLSPGFEIFGEHVVLGDDTRIPPGKGKPHPHIWYTCLGSLNEARRAEGLSPIKPEECLIFEDGLPGVQSAISSGATVIWIPDQKAIEVMDGKHHDIISSYGEILPTLEHFDKEKYGL